MKYVRLIFLVSAALFCAPVMASNRAEVLHWWTSGGEAAAVRVLADAFSKAGGEWVDSAIAGGAGSSARMSGLSRIAGGQPPTAMQFNLGRQFNDLVASGHAADLTSVAMAEGWDRALPRAVYDAVVRDGHVYGVPVNIHGVNWSWWSASALARTGAEPPDDWAGFVKALDGFKAAGIIPLALGGEAWQETILFNFVLNAVGGRDLFDAVYVHHDAAAIKSPRFRAAVEEFLRLKAYVDPGSIGRSWNDTTAMVISAKAGVQVMGDWAKGEFQKAGLVAPRDYRCQIGASARSPLIFTGDLFVMIRLGTEKPTATQELLARTLGSPEVQVAFNAAKGSIPARTDSDVSGFDACARASFAAMRDPARAVPDVDFTNSPDQVGSYRDAVTALWNAEKPDIDAFVARMSDAASM